MKKILTLLVFAALCTSLSAKPVDQATACKTGLNFLTKNAPNAFRSSAMLSLAYKAVDDGTSASTIYYYVFNSDHGFVIVAGDDQAMPILGYSDEGSFDQRKMPLQVSEWLEGYKSQMAYITANNLPATTEISSQWNVLTTGNAIAAPQQAAAGVNPLLQVTWDQTNPYNATCPHDNGTGRNAVTGCVATAMAQLMKFWAYPAKGIGYHSYTDPIYGTQSASFGATTYSWASMPNVLSSANTAVANIMYQCGVSVNMDYGVNESDANVLSSQSAGQNCAEYALKAYFGYDASLQGVLRSAYSDANWISAIEAELNAGRPVIYTGTGNGGSHCFVCDGYDGNNNLHMNWGWGGLYDGYFPINALNPGVGTGGGSGYYNSNQQAIIGIQPSKALLSYSMVLHSQVALSGDSLTFLSPFTLTTSLSNLKTNSHNFKGDFCAEVFDNTNTLIDSAINTGISLNMGSHLSPGITFSFGGAPSLLPGVYTVQVFYRPTGGSWSVVSDSGSYTNTARLRIYIANTTISLATPITVTPGTLVQGKSIGVNFNVVNTGPSVLNEWFFVRLYHIDGSSDFLVQRKAASLDPDSMVSGGLSFNNAADTVTPGTYLLVAYYADDSIGVSGFTILGSAQYQNPVKINVAAPPLPNDQYEPDNTADSAYTFTANYTNDTANVSTTGANINTGADVDYYKINLAAGNYYTIWANLDDAHFNPDGLSYSLHAVFSFSTDNGATWSSTFDGNFPNWAVVNGGGSIIFKVAPYFTGQTGTYRLQVHLQQSPGTGIAPVSILENGLNIYPNPAADILNISFDDPETNPERIVLTNLQGRQVFEVNNPSNRAHIQLNTQDIPSGMYILQVQTGQYFINKPVSIVK